MGAYCPAPHSAKPSRPQHAHFCDLCRTITDTNRPRTCPWTLSCTAGPRTHICICLQGAGQILGMGDTGLDLDSCFFRDSNEPNLAFGNFPTDRSGKPLYNSTTHRKVRRRQRRSSTTSLKVPAAFASASASTE